MAAVALVGLATVVGLVAGRGHPQVADLTERTTVLAQLVVGAAALLFYLGWRIDERAELAWLVAGLIAVSVPAVADAVTAVAAPQAEPVVGGLVAGQLLVVAALAVLALTHRHGRVRPDPAVFGLLVGGATALVAVLPDHPVPIVASTALQLATAAGGLAAAALLGSLAPRGTRIRYEVLAGSVALVVGRAVAGSAADHHGLTVVASACMVAGAGALLLAAVSTTGDAVGGTRRAVNRLAGDLDDLASDAERDRGRLHEVGATLAGIAAASTLLHDGSVPAPHRDELEHLVESEVARLQRLASREDETGRTTADLDAVLEPLVAAHRVRGCRIEWQPSGRRVHGRPDAIATILNVLLENAQRHAPGSPVSVRTVPGDETAGSAGTTVVLVSDRGPGVPAALREQIFDWGRSGPGWAGQGIGLSVARRLARETGGELTLRPSGPVPGATFALELRAVRSHTTEEAVDEDG